MKQRRFLFVRTLRKLCPPLGRVYVLSKMGFPFMWPHANPSDMRRLRTHVRRTMFSHVSQWRQRLARTVMLLGWPFGALIDTLYNLAYSNCPRNLGALIRRGKHMLTAALCDNATPLEYVAYGLHEADKREWTDQYLYWTENQIFRLLCAHSGANADDVQNKSRFAEICKDRGLPCIPTLAAYLGGQQLAPSTPFLPSQEHLWVKSLSGKQGQGASEWRREKQTYRNRDGAAWTPQELADDLRTRNCIVQPFVRNHVALDGISCGLLITCRVLTGIDTAGKTHVITHDITLPWGNWDNRPFFAFGKVGGDGRIAQAMMGNGTRMDRHPDTGVVISSIVVPFWNEVLELAQHAHASAFPHFVFLGWDIAITNEGPLLIEANSSPGVFHHQLLDNAPLGHTMFPRIALQYIES